MTHFSSAPVSLARHSIGIKARNVSCQDPGSLVLVRPAGRTYLEVDDRRLHPESALPLMTDGQNDGDISDGIVLVKRDVARPPARNHQFPKSVVDQPSDQGMSGKNLDAGSQQHPDGLGAFAIILQQKIGDPVDVLKGPGGEDKSCHC
jgi:hypothetical protein